MLEFFIIFIIILIDQVSKYLAVTCLKPIGSAYYFKKSFFSLTYVENRGAAFGILQNQRWFFITLTIIICIAIAYFLIIGRIESLIWRISLSMILGGAIGNLIDRIKQGYVVDMFHFTFIDFPVFNVADLFIVIGTVLVRILYFIYRQKEGKLIV